MSRTNGTPTISLCMIAKNEEAMIGQAIESVKAIVSEIILVDTGSTDRTVEIARSLRAVIIEEPWNDDFSAPRNRSLERATGDWILVLDADEAINPKDHPTLIEQLRYPNRCYEMKQRHYANDPRLSKFTPVRGEFPEFERTYSGYFESGLVRLFPNNRGVRYVGRIHELVEHSIYKLPELSIVQSPIRIHHYGHTPEVRARKDKGALYTPLGEQKLSDTQADWKAYFELGVEHNCNGRHRESITAFLKSIDLHPTYLSSWVNIGYVYCEVGEFQNAIKALGSAITIDPNSEEAYCNLSVVYMRLPHFPTAEKYARHAVTINPKYVNAYNNLGKALANQGRLAEAALVFRRALELMPRCSSAKIDLATLYLNVKDFKSAEAFFRSAIDDGPVPPDVHFRLGALCQAAKRIDEATAYFRRFCAETSQENLPPTSPLAKMREFASRSIAAAHG